jgi:Holliday junction resolvase RusA-like endonuclease
MSEVTLPAPPSVNKAYRNASQAEIGRGARGRIKTAEYASWAIEAGYAINLARMRPQRSPISIRILIGKVNESRDIDNFAKLICDILKTHQIIEDDSMRHIHRLMIEKAFGSIPDGKVKVCVASLPTTTDW